MFSIKKHLLAQRRLMYQKQQSLSTNYKTKQHIAQWKLSHAKNEKDNKKCFLNKLKVWIYCKLRLIIIIFRSSSPLPIHCAKYWDQLQKKSQNQGSMALQILVWQNKLNLLMIKHCVMLSDIP